MRFATEKYSTKSSTLKKRFVHLTNYSVNKKASKYKSNSNTNFSPTKKMPEEMAEGDESEDVDD